MTETEHAEQPRPPDVDRPGVDREHLRDYTELRRSLSERRIAGVCGGLGRHLNVDPTVLRVLFVVLTLFGGAGLVAYLVAWVVVPEDGKDHAVLHTAPSARNGILLIAGIVTAVILVGHSWGGFWFRFPWPLAVFGLLALALVLGLNRPHESAAPVTAGDSLQAGPARDEPPAWTVPPPYQPLPPRKARRRGPLLFPVALALIAIGCGVLGLYDAGAGHRVLASAYPVLALAIVGVLLVIGAFVARPGGLIALGLATLLALGLTSIADVTGGAESWSNNRNVTYAPTGAATLRPSYTNSVGAITLDLTRVDPALLAGRTLSVNGRAGRLDVVLPAGVQAIVDARVQVGDLTIGDQNQSGTGVHDLRTIGDSAGPIVRLNLQLFVGDIEVRTSNS